MNLKQAVDKEIRRREADIAAAAVKAAIKSGIPGKTPVEDVLAELREDERLWTAFADLTLADLRELIAETDVAGKYGPSGGDRRHGVTAGRIVAYIADHPGCALGDVSKALGLERGAVTSQMRALRAAGKVRVEGVERRYRYYVG